MVFVAGHFGEWLQGRLGPDGPLALVTLMCPAHGVTGGRLDDGPLRIDGATLVLNQAQAAICLETLGLPPVGRFDLFPSLPPGGGAGMSTAALVALARLAGADEDGIARACLSAEGASDPLMHPHPDRLLWAPRRAEVIRPLDPVPPCDLLGGFWGPPQRTDPQDTAFPDVSDLVSAWCGADLAERARLASLSAERCTELRGPSDDPMPRLAITLGALGHARAHTGPARVLIFPPGGIPVGAEAQFAKAGLTEVFRFSTGGQA
ncbi:propanediol utilization protein [Antarctobacter jejuensis]|uniref:propanediol utilization protein n=1 Tax=Antarctobacter jejuensis TaxID=1439938 RepID=UPI003FD633A5